MSDNKHYTIYNSSGKILRSVVCPPRMAQIQKKSGESLVEGASDIFNDMVVGGKVVPRPENPITISGTTLSNVPLPSTISIGKTSYDATDSTVELSFSVPGKYYVRVESFPFKDKVFEVTA